MGTWAADDRGYEANTMRMYKEAGNESIPGDRPAQVNLEEALRELDDHKAVEGNFIGFVSEKDETIQFIRYSKDEWLIDVPVIIDGEYAYSLQDNLKHSQAKEIVSRLSRGEEWESLCHLSKIDGQNSSESEVD